MSKSLFPFQQGIVHQPSSTTTRQTTTNLKLSLISPTEFTILSYDSMGIPSGDRVVLDKFWSTIEDIASAHGGATIENPSSSEDNDELLGTTRMRIPLKCYDQATAYLERRSDIALEGIPEAHRKLAELHFQTQGDGEYPKPSELVEKGIPEHLASTLTGYQRQGVAFVLSRDGKALVCDDMGLGKTIQVRSRGLGG
jgi:SNF2 family DNA or RNA helicase